MFLTALPPKEISRLTAVTSIVTVASRPGVTKSVTSQDHGVNPP